MQEEPPDVEIAELCRECEWYQSELHTSWRAHAPHEQAAGVPILLRAERTSVKKLSSICRFQSYEESDNGVEVTYTEAGEPRHLTSKLQTCRCCCVQKE